MKNRDLNYSTEKTYVYICYKHFFSLKSNLIRNNFLFEFKALIHRMFYQVIQYLIINYEYNN